MSWTPDPHAFLADLEAKPASLRALATHLAEDHQHDMPRERRIVLVGMGSQEAMVKLVDRLGRTKTNEEFYNLVRVGDS